MQPNKTRPSHWLPRKAQLGDGYKKKCNLVINPQEKLGQEDDLPLRGQEWEKQTFQKHRRNSGFGVQQVYLCKNPHYYYYYYYSILILLLNVIHVSHVDSILNYQDKTNNVVYSHVHFHVIVSIPNGFW